MLTDLQRDRAAGVLLGQAIGDALGVPYEFGPVPSGDTETIGGGRGPYEPGEWSDDTQMAVCVGQVAATGADLTTDDSLERVAENVVAWRAVAPRTSVSGRPRCSMLPRLATVPSSTG